MICRGQYANASLQQEALYCGIYGNCAGSPAIKNIFGGRIPDTARGRFPKPVYSSQNLLAERNSGTFPGDVNFCGEALELPIASLSISGTLTEIG